MRDEEWIETLEDGRRVKFTNQELDDWAFVTAEVEGNKRLFDRIDRSDKTSSWWEKLVRKGGLEKPPNRILNNMQGAGTLSLAPKTL